MTNYSSETVLVVNYDELWRFARNSVLPHGMSRALVRRKAQVGVEQNYGK